MTREQREVVADWLIVIGALALFGSLFLTWSHQFSPAFLAKFGASDQLRRVPRDPTAWQVYSAADVLLALLAAGLMSVALIGTRGPRSVALVAAIIGLAFTLQALSRPPTNGANIFDPTLSVPDYFQDSADAGPGETVAIAALIAGIGGLVVSYTTD